MLKKMLVFVVLASFASFGASKFTPAATATDSVLNMEKGKYGIKVKTYVQAMGGASAITLTNGALLLTGNETAIGFQAALMDTTSSDSVMGKFTFKVGIGSTPASVVAGPTIATFVDNARDSVTILPADTLFAKSTAHSIAVFPTQWIVPVFTPDTLNKHTVAKVKGQIRWIVHWKN